MTPGQWLLATAGAGIATAPAWQWLIKKPLEPIHFVFFVFGAALLAVSVWGPKAAPKVALSVIPTLIFGVGVELFFYATQHGLPRAVAAQNKGVDFDHRSVFDVVKDLRAAGGKAVPFASPLTLQKSGGLKHDNLVPLAPVANSATVVCNEDGTYMVTQADSLGFNNPDNRTETGDYAVALLGDSFAHGSCVQKGQEISSQLSKNGLKTANFGMGGTGPLTHLAVLKEYVAPSKPKRVVWALYVNDLNDLTDELRFEGIKNYLNPKHSQNLRSRQTEIDQAMSAWISDQEIAQEQRGWFATGSFVHRLATNIEGTITLRRTRIQAKRVLPQPTQTLDTFDTVLGAFKATVNSWNGQLVVVLLPDLIDFRVPGPIQNRDLNLIRKAVQNAGIEILSVKPVLQATGAVDEVFPLGVYGHYTALGYAAVAGEIAKALKRLPQTSD